jgi:dTMP kinase
LITLEGIEGSGKTTQCAKVAAGLRAAGYRVVQTREPGGTPLAERIRGLLLAPLLSGKHAETVDPQAEAHLIMAARSQHVARVIRPAMEAGAIVLCDRFIDSTLAYQGYGRGLTLNKLLAMHRHATGGLMPDLTLLFDLPVTAGLGRRRRGGRIQNRLDRESRLFHQRIRTGFLELTRRYPRRMKTIDARADEETITRQALAFVWPIVSKKLKR